MKPTLAILLLCLVGCSYAQSPADKSAGDHLLDAINTLSLQVEPMKHDYVWLTEILRQPEVRNCSAKHWPQEDEHCNRIAAAMMKVLSEKYQTAPGVMPK